MTARGQTPRVPFWAVPVLVAVPVWAWVYVGTLSPAEPSASATIGADVYAAQCAACHGSEGQGGTGPAFGDGAVFETWPSFEDHIEWVQLGGAAWAEQHGPTYGANESAVNGSAMPAFGTRLTDLELVAVVLYERTVLAGTNPDPSDEQRLREVTSTLANDPSITLNHALDSANRPDDP